MSPTVQSERAVAEALATAVQAVRGAGFGHEAETLAKADPDPGSAFGLRRVVELLLKPAALEKLPETVRAAIQELARVLQMAAPGATTVGAK